MTDQHPAFFAHQEGDAVAVAVRDLEPGPVVGGYLSSEATEEVELAHAVPLGHKVALRDVAQGDRVIEYGLPIGIASADIARGDYVHTHNLRSAKWQTSVA